MRVFVILKEQSKQDEDHIKEGEDWNFSSNFKWRSTETQFPFLTLRWSQHEYAFVTVLIYVSIWFNQKSMKPVTYLLHTKSIWQTKSGKLCREVLWPPQTSQESKVPISICIWSQSVIIIIDSNLNHQASTRGSGPTTHQGESKKFQYFKWRWSLCLQQWGLFKTIRYIT